MDIARQSQREERHNNHEKRKFSEDLLETVIEKNEFVMELIKPKLKNWDADRIASLDLIIFGVKNFFI